MTPALVAQWALLVSAVLALVWTMRCPWCSLFLVKLNPLDRYTCPRCGWSG